jgi:hypothetical protein
MITDLLIADHQAGTDFFSLAGNSVLPARAERAGQLDFFRTLWTRHRAALDRAVFPVLLQGAAHDDLVVALRGYLDAVDTHLDRLSRDPDYGAAAPDDWLTDFERLKDAFDAAAEAETTDLIPLILNSLRPDQVAAMTHEAVARRAEPAPGAAGA